MAMRKNALAGKPATGSSGKAGRVQPGGPTPIKSTVSGITSGAPPKPKYCTGLGLKHPKGSY